MTPDGERSSLVDEAQLLDALSSDHAADAACRQAIEDGGTVTILPGRIPTEHLAQIYAVRVRHLAAQGVETIGSEDVVERLNAADGTLQLASVKTADRHFVVFLDGRRVISSWGVPARYANDAHHAAEAP
jgi:hypothetical protein